MSSARILVDSSQFPERVWQDLLVCFQERQIAPKFHYNSYKQSLKWMRLHEAFAPSLKDPDYAAVYDQGSAAAASQLGDSRVDVVGFGCGSGEKDVRLLEHLAGQGSGVGYIACDVSLALVLAAMQNAMQFVPEDACEGIVLDFEKATDIRSLLSEGPEQHASPPANRKVFTFFGMVPNLEPSSAFPRLSALLRAGDLLLVSANLAPGSDYELGVRRVLPQYDNDLTRDWLTTFLFDHGFEPGDGEVRFGIEEASGLKRIFADFVCIRPRIVRLDEHVFEFKAGDRIRLFYSYRYTPSLLSERLKGHGLQVLGQWITPSEEEGVFLVTPNR